MKGRPALASMVLASVLACGATSGSDRGTASDAGVDGGGPLSARWAFSHRAPGAGYAVAPTAGGAWVAMSLMTATSPIVSPPAATDGLGTLLLDVDTTGRVTAARTLSNGPDPNRVVPSGVAVDGAGNRILVGSFRGTFDFGTGPLTTEDIDAFIVVYGADGATRWARRFGGPGYDAANDVAVAKDGRIAVGGSFGTRIDLGSGAITSKGLSDAFVVVISPDGQPMWSRTCGSPRDDSAHAFAFAPDGGVCLAGQFSDTIDLGTGPLVFAGGADALVACFDKDGQTRWAKSFGGLEHDQATAVAIGPDGRVFFSGEISGSMSIGGPVVRGHDGEWDGFVAAYSAAGEHLWSRAFGGEARDRGGRLALAPSGELAVAGFIQSTVDTGAGTLVAKGSTDAVVIVYGPEGDVRAARAFGGSGEDAVHGLTYASDGLLYVTGRFAGFFDLDGHTVTGAAGAIAGGFVAALR